MAKKPSIPHAATDGLFGVFGVSVEPAPADAAPVASSIPDELHEASAKQPAAPLQPSIELQGDSCLTTPMLLAGPPLHARAAGDEDIGAIFDQDAPRDAPTNGTAHCARLGIEVPDEGQMLEPGSDPREPFVPNEMAPSLHENHRSNDDLCSMPEAGAPDANTPSKPQPAAHGAAEPQAGPAGVEGAQLLDDKRVADAVMVVEDHLRENDVTVLFDGSMQSGNVPIADHYDEGALDACLTYQKRDEATVRDDIVLKLRAANVQGIPPSLIAIALRVTTARLKKQRLAEVMKPLLKPLSREQQEDAEAQFRRLAETVFPEQWELSLACIKHTIWQVKRKAINKPVSNHLFVVFYNPVQACGKTNFAKRLCDPLQELAIGPVLLAELVDPRFSEIVKYLVILIDDIDAIGGSGVQILKSLITGETLPRRKVGTGSSRNLDQRSTLIGTSNLPIHAVVPDDTGSRRFAVLPFKNGNPDRGGDERVWQVINETDFKALWQSVNPWAESPLKPHLQALAAEQEKGNPTAIVHNWLKQLNVNSDAVMNIATGYGSPLKFGIPSRSLHELFVQQTGVEKSETWFARTVASFLLDPLVPLGGKHHTAKARLWTLKVQPMAEPPK